MISDSIPYLPNWRGTKLSVSDGIDTIEFHSIPSCFLQSKQWSITLFHSISSPSISSSKHSLTEKDDGKNCYQLK